MVANGKNIISKAVYRRGYLEGARSGILSYKDSFSSFQGRRLYHTRFQGIPYRTVIYFF